MEHQEQGGAVLSPAQADGDPVARRYHALALHGGKDTGFGVFDEVGGAEPPLRLDGADDRGFAAEGAPVPTESHRLTRRARTG